MIRLQDLKNTMKVAAHTGKPESFSAELCNDIRDIKIFVTYHPEQKPEEDIYPYWSLDMREEETCQTVWLTNLKEVRNMYNEFIAQQNSNESFLETLKVR